MVYVRIQPYHQNAFRLRGSLKLRPKYYEPFKVLQRIDQVSYKLQLPDTAAIHPVFHISHLKEHVGKHAVPLRHIPLVTEDGKIKMTPFSWLDSRTIISRKKIPLEQWLIHWEIMGPDNSTSEDVGFIEMTSPSFKP